MVERSFADHRKRLVELAEGWECAARLTNEIIKAFQPELDEFSASKMRDGKVYDIRLIRSVLDERSARDGYLKDAEALRALLALVPEPASEPGAPS